MGRSNIVKCKTDTEKSEIVKGWAWQNTLTKTAFANQYGISVRTLNRILAEKEDTLSSVNVDYTVTKNQVTIFVGDESESIQKGYPRFKEFRNKLIKEEFSDEALLEVYEVMSLPKFVEKFSEGNITVDHENSKVFYGTFEIKNSLVNHLMTKLNEGHDPKGFVRFMEMLMDNPKKGVVDELYNFLNHNDISITDEGYILAYRSVTNDFKDFHTRTMDNSIGNVVKMPRTFVDGDPNKTCSSGLHCASIEYAKDFGNGRLVKVLVNPMHVVSVPVDYDGQKLRCCEFKVIEEVV